MRKSSDRFYIHKFYSNSQHLYINLFRSIIQKISKCTNRQKFTKIHNSISDWVYMIELSINIFPKSNTYLILLINISSVHKGRVGEASCERLQAYSPTRRRLSARHKRTRPVWTRLYSHFHPTKINFLIYICSSQNNLAIIINYWF